MYDSIAQESSGKIYKKPVIALAFAKRIELKSESERKIPFPLCILLHLLSFSPYRIGLFR